MNGDAHCTSCFTVKERHNPLLCVPCNVRAAVLGVLGIYQQEKLLARTRVVPAVMAVNQDEISRVGAIPGRRLIRKSNWCDSRRCTRRVSLWDLVSVHVPYYQQSSFPCLSSTNLVFTAQYSFEALQNEAMCSVLCAVSIYANITFAI